MLQFNHITIVIAALYSQTPTYNNDKIAQHSHTERFSSMVQAYVLRGSWTLSKNTVKN